MPLDIRSQVVTALDNINKNPEPYTPPKSTTPLETRINDLKETNPSKYKEYISTLTSSANNRNKEARELLGRIGEDAARQRRGYEGLNEFMTASTGGLPGIIANYLPKTIGSTWNGYSMFDPNSSGIVTKSYQNQHPGISTLLNIGLGIVGGGLAAKNIALRNPYSLTDNYRYFRATSPFKRLNIGKQIKLQDLKGEQFAKEVALGHYYGMHKPRQKPFTDFTFESTNANKYLGTGSESDVYTNGKDVYKFLYRDNIFGRPPQNISKIKEFAERSAYRRSRYPFSMTTHPGFRRTLIEPEVTFKQKLLEPLATNSENMSKVRTLLNSNLSLENADFGLIEDYGVQNFAKDRNGVLWGIDIYKKGGKLWKKQ